VGGHIGRCDFARLALTIPRWISTGSGSGGRPVLGGLISKYERAA
jgi:hypothetical protein